MCVWPVPNGTWLPHGRKILAWRQYVNEEKPHCETDYRQPLDTVPVRVRAETGLANLVPAGEQRSTSAQFDLNSSCTEHVWMSPQGLSLRGTAARLGLSQLPPLGTSWRFLFLFLFVSKTNNNDKHAQEPQMTQDMLGNSTPRRDSG